MYIESGSVLKAHVKRNIPEKLWYSSTRNGVTRVAYARLVELEINEIRRNLKPGPPKPCFEIFVSGTTPTFNFSDRTELMVHDGSGKALRLQEGICGNMADFNQFCETFPVVAGPPIWIPSAEKLQRALGFSLGTIGDRTNFREVLELASRFIMGSHLKLKD